MRKLLAGFAVVAMSLLPVASAGAVPSTTGTDPTGSTVNAAAWLISQISPSGTLDDPYNPGHPDIPTTAQAVLALAAAGQGRSQVDAMMGFLSSNLETYVHRGATDSPGALAYLILDSVATGRDPHDFGGQDLVARLQATQRTSAPDAGLFGLTDLDPTYDGVFRQGLSLLALHAVGVDDTAGTTWLEDQRCADGSFVAYRSDTTVACPALDITTFTGPDTNSTALGAIALHAEGDDVSSSMTWLDSVRTADGGFTYFGDPSGISDASSTGLVLQAFLAVDGTVDAGGVDALGALQVPCSGPEADRGAVAFQLQGTDVVPNAAATVQALWGLSGRPFPLVDASIDDAPIVRCAVPVSESTSTTSAPPTSLVAVAPSTTSSAVVPSTQDPSTVGVDELPRTGGSILGYDAATVGLFGLFLLTAGGLVVVGSWRRDEPQTR